MGTGASFTTTYATKGTFVVNATATDNNSAKKSQTVSIVVAAQPIVITVTCGSATTGKPVTCSASATGGTGPYTFTWVSKGSPASARGSSYTTTFAVKGLQTVNATATDVNSVSRPGQATIIVTAQPIAATINASPAVETAGRTAIFSATGSGGTAPYIFRWSFGDSSPVQFGSPVSHLYSAAGDYTVMLNVTDANAARISQTQVYRVVPPPIPSFRITPAEVVVGHLGIFNATVSGGVAPYTFSWNFGDSSFGTGANISHLYSLSGNYSISLNVTDSNGASKTVSRFLIVWKNPDINGDHIVDIVDVATVALAYSAKVGDPRYDPRLDLNGDGKIDISDVAAVAF